MKAEVRYVVMSSRNNEPFPRFREKVYLTEEAAEAAILNQIEDTDAFCGCPDLFVRKVFHAVD